MKDFEKELVQKMNTLSDNVNCFDKISQRAFPNENPRTEDGYFSESGLENITGKRRFTFAPVLLAVFTIILSSVIIMQGSMKEFFYNLKKNNCEYYNTFDDIKSELDYELDNFSYTYYELTFDEYIMNIGCINPLAEYPLIREKEDTKIRVYTKVFTIDNKRTETNQIYLVHYFGEYCDENIISITDTKAKFNKNDQYNATLTPNSNISWDNLIYSSYINENMENIFQIGYHYLYKDGNKVYDLLTAGLFWFDENDENSDTKHYSLVSMYMDTGYVFKILNPVENLWNETVYQYDEHTGFQNEESLFVKENLVDDILNQYSLEYTNDETSMANLFIDTKDDIDDFQEEITPVYYSQINSVARSIDVKITEQTDDLLSITKVTSYQNDLFFNNRENKQSKEYTQKIEYFNFDTIETLFCENIELSAGNLLYIDITNETISEYNNEQTENDSYNDENYDYNLIFSICNDYIINNFSLDTIKSSSSDVSTDSDIANCKYIYDFTHESNDEYTQIIFYITLERIETSPYWQIININAKIE